MNEKPQLLSNYDKVTGLSAELRNTNLAEDKDFHCYHSDWVIHSFARFTL